MTSVHLFAVAFAGVALLSAMADATAPTLQSTALRVVSSNVRNADMHDGPDGWTFRKEFLFATIRAFDPDVIGLQEVLASQQDDFEHAFPAYKHVGVGREDGKRAGEFASIFFRADRFDLLDGGTFWLSTHPDVPGSRDWDAALTRICSWAKLKDRRSGRTILLANTHFDHMGAVARENSAKLLAEKLRAIANGAPVILTGDFNSTEDDRPYHILTHAADSGGLRLIDSYREVHPQREPDEASFNGFKGTVTGTRIDWILHTPDVKALSSEIDRAKSPEGRFPSDHYPVKAVLDWR